VITFGTLLSSEIIQPQITSIEQPENEIAEIAFELLEKMITGDVPDDELVEREVKAKIIFRESC
jgi:DNA-binding LacI/PurR family transcriptional regulator